MSAELIIPGLPLSLYCEQIKLNEKYVPKPGTIYSEDKKDRIVDSLLFTLTIEEGLYNRNQVPDDYVGKRNLLRALLNIRPPSPVKKSFLEKIEWLLQLELGEKKIISLDDLLSISNESTTVKLKHGKILFLWKGDITCLKVDAIVNAANDRMLGCFQPLHNCIDNVIHSAAGPLLREDCKTIMDIQQSREQTGDAKITRAYNLPSKYVLHTVGPIVQGADVSEEQKEQLSSCYKSCLSLAAEIKEIKSIAFPCISTGVFNFPQILAAEIAVRAVDEWLNSHSLVFSHIIFNVFLEEDFSCYAGIFRRAGN
jgi:O-acetyl-ADP-ribose deacetylase (regulator of RNase III)